MSDIATIVCDAVEVIVDRKISQASYDRTVQAIVLSCVDKTIGKYKVKYQDSIFYAYSNNTDISYSDNSTVYILIPGNDTGADKTILGSVSQLGTSYVPVGDEANEYQIKGNNCVTSSGTEYGVKSYGGSQEIELYNCNKSNSLVQVDTLAVDQYIKNSNTIICGVTIRTDLPKEQQFNGDYGVRFVFDFHDNTGNKTIPMECKIDTSKMTDNPYKFFIPVRQSGIFNGFEGRDLVRLHSIVIFCNNFPLTDSNKPEDIWFKDFELYGAEKLTEEELNGYCITFETPNGTFFSKQDVKGTTLPIKAQVRIKGEPIDNDTQKLPYYWFRENSSVGSDHNRYNANGGRGWECLNDFNEIAPKEEGDSTVIDWIAAENTFNVIKGDGSSKTPQDIEATKNGKGDILSTSEATYKCVAIYDESIVISKTITISNLGPKYKITIESDQGTQFYFDNGSPTLTCRCFEYDVTTNEDTDTEITDSKTANLMFDWSVTNNSGDYEDLSNNDIYNEEYNDYVNTYNEYHKLLDSIAKGEIPQEPYQQTLEDYKHKIQEYEAKVKVEVGVGKNKCYVNVHSIIEYSIYKCAVYMQKTDNNNLLVNEYIGTAAITLTNSFTADKNSYYLTLNDGSHVFKYDYQGVSPACHALNKPITLKALTFNLIDNTGNRIDDEIINNKCDIQWIVPIEDTLLQIPDDVSKDYQDDEKNGIRIYKGKILSLPYLIEDRYDITKINNNNIKLIVNYQGMTLSTSTNFVFTKEGENGTNGTEYFCRIVPNVRDEDSLPAYPVLIDETSVGKGFSLNYNPDGYQGEEISGKAWFKVELWHNDTRIFKGTESGTITDDTGSNESNSSKSVSVDWSILQDSEENLFSIESNGTCTLIDVETIEDEDSYNYFYIIKAEVKYNGVVYYATIPFIVIRKQVILSEILRKGSKDEHGVTPIPIKISTNSKDSNQFSVYGLTDIDVQFKEKSGFLNAVYTSDGKDPRYDNTNPFEIVVKGQARPAREYTIEKSNTSGNSNSPLDQDLIIINSLDETKNEQGEYANNWVIEDLDLLDKNKIFLPLHIRYSWEPIGSMEEDNDEDQGTYTKSQWFKPKDDYDGDPVTNGLHIVVDFRELRKEYGGYGGYDTSSGSQGYHLIIADVYIPIHLMLNRYGNSAINGWDGNSVSIDKEGNGVILAPQVGAGEKDEDNTFTGIVIGKVKEVNKTDREVGLFGYSHGIRSIFLDAHTGKSIFGTPGKGQIIIDPSTNQAIIQSGNFINKDEEEHEPGAGMQINLTIPSIAYGNENFSVDANGFLTAKGGGNIAGWTIGENRLESAHNTIILDGKNETITVGEDIDNGNHWIISMSTKNNHQYPHIGYNAEFAYIKTEDKNYSDDKNVDTKATIEIDEKNDEVQKQSVYIGTDAIRLGKNFAVNNKGNARINWLFSQDAVIGGWKLASDVLYYWKDKPKEENGKPVIDENGDPVTYRDGGLPKLNAHGNIWCNELHAKKIVLERTKSGAIDPFVTKELKNYIKELIDANFNEDEVFVETFVKA